MPVYGSPINGIQNFDPALLQQQMQMLGSNYGGTPSAPRPPRRPRGPVVASAPVPGAMPQSAPMQPMNFTPEGLAASYTDAYNSAKSANESRYNSILGQYGDWNKQAGQAAGDLNQSLLAGYKQGYEGNVAANAADAQNLQAQYLQRRGGILADLEARGKQEEADINQRWGAEGAQQQQNLRDRGMAGTTIAPTLASGITRETTADQGRLAERVRQQRISTDERLSGDYMRALESGQAARAGRADQYVAGSTALGERGGRYQQDLTNDITRNNLAFQERREDAYPDLGQYASLAMKLGQGGDVGRPSQYNVPRFGGGGSSGSAGSYFQQQTPAAAGATAARPQRPGAGSAQEQQHIADQATPSPENNYEAGQDANGATIYGHDPSIVQGGGIDPSGPLFDGTQRPVEMQMGPAYEASIAGEYPAQAQMGPEYEDQIARPPPPEGWLYDTEAEGRGAASRGRSRLKLVNGKWVTA